MARVRRCPRSRVSTSDGWPWPTRTAIRWWSIGVPRSPSRSIAPPDANPWGWPGAVISWSTDRRSSVSKTSCSAKDTSASATTTASPVRVSTAPVWCTAPGCVATARSWHRSSGVAPVSWVTSSPPSSPSRTRSFVHRRPGFWWYRAVRVPARRSWPCIARRICSTPIVFRSRTKVCSSSVPIESSSATSNGCCRRSARPVSNRSFSPISSTTCAWAPMCASHRSRLG